MKTICLWWVGEHRAFVSRTEVSLVLGEESEKSSGTTQIEFQDARGGEKREEVRCQTAGRVQEESFHQGEERKSDAEFFSEQRNQRETKEERRRRRHLAMVNDRFSPLSLR